MENKPLLSFCIPTYNFGRFIAETILSIEEGAATLTHSDFEIVILDGGSQDETGVVVEGLLEKYDNIRYIKQSARGGIDRDMDTVASHARGNYIWLFSSDDVLVKGWDEQVVPIINSNGPDILLVPAVLCDLNMKVLRNNPIFRECVDDGPVVFNIDNNDNSLYDYLSKAATLEAVFSFMSSLVVKTAVWQSLPNRPDYFGSCWAHCARLIPLLYRKINITYMNKYLIKKRGGNDTFMENGFVARIAIAVDGWGKIIEEFILDRSCREILYVRLRKDMPILLFIYAKITARTQRELINLKAMARLLYITKGFTLKDNINYIVYLMVPASALLNMLIKPFLPTLIRIRHYLKRKVT